MAKKGTAKKTHSHISDNSSSKRIPWCEGDNHSIGWNGIAKRIITFQAKWQNTSDEGCWAINFSVLYIPLTFTNSLYSIDKSIEALHKRHPLTLDANIQSAKSTEKKKDLWYSSKITSSSLSIFSDFPPNLFNVDRFGKVFFPYKLIPVLAICWYFISNKQFSVSIFIPFASWKRRDS